MYGRCRESEQSCVTVSFDTISRRGPGAMMNESPPSHSAVRGNDFFDHEVARVMLVGSGLVSETILAEAIQESRRNPQRSLAAILVESGKISQANREQLERFCREAACFTRDVAAPSLAGSGAANDTAKFNTHAPAPGEATTK